MRKQEKVLMKKDTKKLTETMSPKKQDSILIPKLD